MLVCGANNINIFSHKMQAKIICTSLHESAFVLGAPKDDTVFKVRHGFAGARDMEAASALWVKAADRRSLLPASSTFLKICQKLNGELAINT